MKRMSLATAAVASLLGLAACGGTHSLAPAANTEIETAKSAAEPLPDQMSVARPSGKISVPVDVRYQLGGTAVRDQPMALQLAIIPRVAGENLRVEFPHSGSVTIESGGAALLQQKANAAGVYRRNLVITLRTGDQGEMRVLVSMDVEGGRYFGLFSVPVGD